jgi:hypothetical protein
MPTVAFYMELVEQAWKLSDDVRELAKTAKSEGREITIQEAFDKVFVPSGLVDMDKTRKNSGNPPKVFLNSPYGLQYRPEYKDWIPFRHGDVKFDD